MPGTPQLDDYLQTGVDTAEATEPTRTVSGMAPARERRANEETRAHGTVRSEGVDSPSNEGTVSWQRLADEAMVRYARGDNRAFPQLYDALAPRLNAFLLRRVRSASTATDLLQQTFLQLHVHRGHFIPGSSVAAYAFAICRRLCIDLKRRARPELSVSDGETGALLEVCLEMSSCDGAIDAKAVLAAVKRELDELGPEQHELFELVYLDGLSHAHVAGILGVSANAVKLRANRLRASIARSVARQAALQPR